MLFKAKHIILLIISFITFYSFSQKKLVKGYHFDDEYVVFTFDKRDYLEGTTNYNKEKFNLKNFDIKKVSISGNFNNWSLRKWKMTKINENIYQLKKRVFDFNDAYNWEFKFVLNNAVWAEPSEDIQNIISAKTTYGDHLNTYNLKIFPAKISKKGNAKFELLGYKNAKKVILAGSFNNWNEQIFKMNKTKKGWELILELPANIYEYRFIIDGNWIEDPLNNQKIANEFGEYNSVLNIKKEVSFIIDGFKNAEKVILSGSFNNWSEVGILMKKSKNGWIYKTKLSFGKHHYKYIIDGKWTLDPNNPIKEHDGNGNINSVKMVK